MMAEALVSVIRDGGIWLPRRSQRLVEKQTQNRDKPRVEVVSAKLNGVVSRLDRYVARMSAAIGSVAPDELDAELKRWLEPIAEHIAKAPADKLPAPKIEIMQTDDDEIIGDSAALRATLGRARKVAPTESTVLITGETGTGKELLARAVHRNSKRRQKPLVKVNCAALPASLVEAELFGREKGAYTGAMTREQGRFEVADGGTILLDEIGELPMELQAKLLRVLQEGEFERLGSPKTLKVDVRVIASTNRDLVKAVDSGKFREDLYYRLSVFPIEVPTLAERKDDIPKLVWGFIQQFSLAMGKTIESIPEKSMEQLRAYDWPGNVREVRNIIERAMIISEGPILEVELPCRSKAPRKKSKRMADVEREHITAVARSTGWRIRGQNGAAEILGLKPTTLEARMKRLGIKREPARH